MAIKPKHKNPSFCHAFHLETRRPGLGCASDVSRAAPTGRPDILTSPVYAELTPTPAHLSKKGAIVTGIFEFLAHRTEEL